MKKIYTLLMMVLILSVMVIPQTLVDKLCKIRIFKLIFPKLCQPQCETPNILTGQCDDPNQGGGL